MRAVVQRVASAGVVVAGERIAQTGSGLLVFLCVMAGDDDDDEVWIAGRIANLRIFADDAGKMNWSIREQHERLRARSGDGAGLLVVSQFTLAADLAPGLSRGNRPSFGGAASPEVAQERVDAVVARLHALLPDLAVQTGRFGADMKVELVNDGPVTLWLDSHRGRARPTENPRGGT
jgi:D-tyrosyl-tRNA(Tyr) deacylase